MSRAAQMRSRNTAHVQVGLAFACLVVAALLIVVAMRPGSTTGVPESVAVLVIVAAWMVRRGRTALRVLGNGDALDLH
jgi:hypothetical protein